MNSSLERLNAKENFNYSNTQRIKNIFLSLATISFLATCANSSVIISDPSSSGSIKISKAGKTRAIDDCNEKENTCTIIKDKQNNVTVSGATNVIISEKGIVGDGNANAGVTFKDIKNGEANLINNGVIFSGWITNNRVTIGGVEVFNSNIGSIVNNNTISNKDGGNGAGIFIQKNSMIDNISNIGIIKVGGHGIKSDDSTIGTISNLNTIESDYSGMQLGSANVTFIYNKKKVKGKNFGIEIYNSSNIKTLQNDGLIEGWLAYIAINIRENSTLENLSNSGTIRGKEAGISFENAIGGTLTNAGSIIGRDNTSNGINIKGTSKVDSIISTSSNALIAGVNAGINNEGTIGKNDTSNAITLKQGTITALQWNNEQINTTGNALINNGTIQGNILLTDSAKIIGTLKNTKTITG
ncbi:hypothetical protein, partial [Campylobacter sp. CNRCH_2015_1657]|uniref:hypothetical protein n=1 Tax=Campylobacter sp. CNRCH_2015_1657 TaxID=2911607 RepID=UPI0021E6D47A